MTGGAVAVLLLLASHGDASAQALTPDMLNPSRDGFSGTDQPLRKIRTASDTDKPTRDAADAAVEQPATSRIGKIPTFGNPAATGAAATGYDSLNRKKPARKPLPGSAKAGAAVGAGKARPGNAAQSPYPTPTVVTPLIPTPVAPPSSSTANRAPIPPAMAGSILGQPQRRRLKVDDDPFGPVGFYAGTFLTKAALEISGGYDSNPGRVSGGKGLPFYVIAPELVMASDWERHSLIADLRGSFTGYGSGAASAISGAGAVPTDLDRPDFTGKIDGRIDVSRNTRIDTEARLRVSTDNPGSPNLMAGLSRYPIYTTVGGTLGAAQRFNRLEVSLNGTVDRTDFQRSQLTDGSTDSNNDRNFTQYGGTLRGAYELTPAIKPYVEVQSDRRTHDLNFDRSGYQRDSDGVFGRVGSTFELGRLITGEASIGYASRNYQDPRLRNLNGLLTSASLIWTATPLTTVTLGATSSIDETTLAGVSGVLTRNYTAQVDHAFRRWLIGSLKFGYSNAVYDGAGRTDRRTYAALDVVYKLTRTLQVKGEVRQDWLNSNAPGVDAKATSFMVGMRFQP